VDQLFQQPAAVVAVAVVNQIVMVKEQQVVQVVAQVQM
tara:strand:+ start:337 stop:450 length:114 start_codon:yes stop_codon:yes gene_type:complete